MFSRGVRVFSSDLQAEGPWIGHWGGLGISSNDNSVSGHGKLFFWGWFYDQKPPPKDQLGYICLQNRTIPTILGPF